MPLRKLINQSMLSPEDADLLESLFNQFYAAGENESDRQLRASGLVKMFVEGQRDREMLVQYLVGSEVAENASGGRQLVGYASTASETVLPARLISDRINLVTATGGAIREAELVRAQQGVDVATALDDLNKR